MATKIFLNLPVKDLTRSIDFFTAIGFKFNPKFTDETSACMIISDEIYAMLLSHAKFKEFTTKEICDQTKSIAGWTSLSWDDRQQVDEVVRKAVAAGAKADEAPSDYGFMYSQAFEDLDGHSWNHMWIDPKFGQS